MTEKEDYTRRLEARLKQWDDRLDTLHDRAVQMGGDMKKKFEDQRTHLAQLREDTGEALSALRERGEAAWEEARDKTEAAWDKMTDQLEKISSKFTHK